MEQDVVYNESQHEQEKGLIVLALNITYTNQRVLNCAVYNKNKRTFYVCQFSDNEYFSCLEGFLIQLNPKDLDSEFRLIYTLPELETQAQKLNQLFEGITTQQFSQAAQKKKFDTHKSLGFLLDNSLSHYYVQMNNSKNMNILMKLIDELKLENDQTNSGKMKLEVINLQKYMKLDHAAISALQIFSKSHQKKIISSNETLFDLICKCKTSIGTRTLKRWMKQPLQDQVQINKRLDFVEYFMKNTEMRAYIQNEVLNSVCDLEKLYFTFYKVASDKPCKTEMSDLIKIFKLVKTLERFVEKMNKQSQSTFQKENIYDVLAENVVILSNPVKMIEKNVVMEGRQNQYYIKPSTQQSLHKIMEEKNRINLEIEQEFKRAKKQLKIDIQLIKMGNTNQYHMFEGPKQKVQDAIKTKGINEYKHGLCRGKKMTFKSNILSRLSDNLKELEAKYILEQKIILNKMIKTIATYYQILEKVSETLSNLDIFTSWALFLSGESLSTWSRPHFGPQLLIKQVRHPCVVNCIPSDLDLKGNQRCAIITGPNMGGKSTFIRMVGVSVYLSHIGFFVPALFYQSPIIDAIITRVGASDAQLQGVSTFMNQMLESACALSSASSKSLVLIDELGRGTSTHQGFGIAWGICEYLHTQIHSYCLFATHFHELTLMQEEVEGVINLHASCVVTKDNIMMNYRIIPGKAHMSYGIQLIKSMNFPQRIVSHAEDFYDGLQNFEHHTPKENTRESQNFNKRQEIVKTVQNQKNQTSQMLIETPVVANKYKNLYLQEQLNSNKRTLSYEYKTKLVEESEKLRNEGMSEHQIYESLKSCSKPL